MDLPGTVSLTTKVKHTERAASQLNAGLQSPFSLGLDCFDVLIIGAGAAGLMCAARAGQSGLKVALIDHAGKLAEKIRISGGGRCNFTNRNVSAENFISRNPHFCKSALSKYRPSDFLELVERYGIRYHEKHKGQLFCDGSSQQIIDMLVAECAIGEVALSLACTVRTVTRRPGGIVANKRPETDQASKIFQAHESAEAPCIKQASDSKQKSDVEALGETDQEAGVKHFVVDTNLGILKCKNLVVATGGLSIPKIGASDFGYSLATQFGHQLVESAPTLVPLTFDSTELPLLPGLSLPVTLSCETNWQAKGCQSFDEDLLFTHKGLSGPAILQISNYWDSPAPIHINLAPKILLADALKVLKRQSKQTFFHALLDFLPRRLVEMRTDSALGKRRLADMPDALIARAASEIQYLRVSPTGSEGYLKAEVTRGGVNTLEVAQATMESNRVAVLFFIGEVLDVTGWLGGYNFQWAWSSAVVCAKALERRNKDQSPTVAQYQ